MIKFFIKSFITKLINLIYFSLKARKLHLRLESLDITRDCIFEGNNYIHKGVKIGPKCKIGRFSYLSGPSTVINDTHIGKFCSLALGVKIGLDEHDYNLVSTHPFLYSSKYGKFVDVKNSIQKKGKTIIEDDVWIGAGSIILKGIKISKGAVIAAGSVVTKDVEPYSIYAGVPAKMIKKRFDDETIKKLLKIDWCTMDDIKIKESLQSFYKVKDFIRQHDI